MKKNRNKFMAIQDDFVLDEDGEPVMELCAYSETEALEGAQEAFRCDPEEEGSDIVIYELVPRYTVVRAKAVVKKV